MKIHFIWNYSQGDSKMFENNVVEEEENEGIVTTNVYIVLT